MTLDVDDIPLGDVDLFTLVEGIDPLAIVATDAAAAAGSRALIGKTSQSTRPAASSAATAWRFGIWRACLRPPRESNAPGRCSRSFPAWGNRGRSIGARGCAPACRVHPPPACHGASTARIPRPRAFQSSRLVCHSHPHRARAQIIPRNEKRPRGRRPCSRTSGVKRNLWNDLKNTPLIIPSQGYIYPQDKIGHIGPKRSAICETLRPSKPVNLTERAMRIPKVPYEKNVAFNHGPYSPVHMEPS